MSVAMLREWLETRQVAIYFAVVVLGAAGGALLPGTSGWEPLINPSLALMLFVTFLQVPMGALGKALRDLRFLGVLMAVNFLLVPLLVALLLPITPADPLVRLGVLLVLLCPCIDYVVTFAHLGRADAGRLLAATPALLVAQMLLLPVYLRLFLGEDAEGLVQAGPFLDAFLWLVILPFALALACQLSAKVSALGGRVVAALGVAPVPATALVLFVVVIATTPQLGAATGPALMALPVYAAFALLAPILGWIAARTMRLKPKAARAIAFSAGTRNSLVVLPLALAVPGAIPVLPAVIVAQTLLELAAELIYVRVAPWLGRQSQNGDLEA